MTKFSGIENVMELNYSNFDKTKNIKKDKCSNKPGIILFYYDWCGYCNMMVPEFAKLSKKKNISLYVVNGDGPSNKLLFKHYEIQGVPYMLFVSKSGKISKRNKYVGNRTAADMMKFIKKYSLMSGGCGNTDYVKMAIKKQKRGGCGCNSKNGFKKILGGKKKVAKRKAIKKKVVNKKK